MVAWSNSGENEKKKYITAAFLQNSNAIESLQATRHPLAKELEDSGYEIGLLQT